MCIGDFFFFWSGDFLQVVMGFWLVQLVTGGLGLVRIGGVGAAAFFFFVFLGTALHLAYHPHANAHCLCVRGDDGWTDG